MGTAATGVRHGALLPLYGITIFTSAFLVFAVQPMFAKMVLPLLGGAPGVWNTAMVFFQAVLLAGYAYAHLSARYLSHRRQVLLHLGVLALAFISLPVGRAAGWTPPTDAMPVPWLIGLFGVSVGLPFFAVAANAPLLQKWFAHSGHAAGADPYFLYGASNLGSILALLSYPAVVEPLLKLDQQGWAWTFGYGALVVLIGCCAAALWRAGDKAAPAPEVRTAPAITRHRRFRWVILAFVPSSLFLGVTTHITVDVASIPLLWVGPLILYLLSFVLVFARKPLLKHRWMVRLMPFSVVPLAVAFWWGGKFWLPYLAVSFSALFFCAMVCHGELARDRPTTRDLTEFYLWMSVGGVLGGVLNALIAPLVFNAVYEYPLALMLACYLRPGRDAEAKKFVLWDLVYPAVIAVVFGLPFFVGLQLADFEFSGVAAHDLILLAAGLLFRHRPVRFALGIGAILFATFYSSTNRYVIFRDRSFFGAMTVEMDRTYQYRLFYHGTTLHGAQNTLKMLRREPLVYYHRSGPIAHVVLGLQGEGRLSNVGVMGLGVGAMACYREPGEAWIFYEIDPAVVRIARDGRFFHYLADCAPDAPVILGDGRLSLAREPDGRFDLLVMDAFSSDSVPLHLLTREALALYLKKLSPRGVLVFHISNRYLNLRPVLARLAADAGLIAQLYPIQPRNFQMEARWKFSATLVVMARNRGDLPWRLKAPPWRPLTPPPGGRVWTDDFSSILETIR